MQNEITELRNQVRTLKRMVYGFGCLLVAGIVVGCAVKNEVIISEHFNKNDYDSVELDLSFSTELNEIQARKIFEKLGYKVIAPADSLSSKGLDCWIGVEWGAGYANDYYVKLKNKSGLLMLDAEWTEAYWIRQDRTSDVHIDFLYGKLKPILDISEN